MRSELVEASQQTRSLRLDACSVFPHLIPCIYEGFASGGLQVSVMCQCAKIQNVITDRSGMTQTGLGFCFSKGKIHVN